MALPTRLYDLGASERRVLEVIWRRGPIARVDIAEVTGLNGATVTRLTRDLRARGLVTDEVLRNGQRGQPVRPLSLRAEGAYAFGVNFSHTYMDTGLIDLTGALVSSERIHFDRPDASAIGRAAHENLLRQIQECGVALGQVVGAGFSLPGDFGETPAFLKAHAYFPDLLDQDLQARFQEVMPLPVYVENDAASAALGERINGIGRKLDNFMFIHIGHGVGGGMVLDGRLHRGVRGNAGSLGVLYPMNEPRPSGQDLLEMLSEAGVGVRDFDDLERLTPESTPALRRWIARAGEQLGQGVHVATRLLDPDATILGGRLPPHLLSALYSAIDVEMAFRRSRTIPTPPLLVSELGAKAGVIGAASICMFAEFFA